MIKKLYYFGLRTFFGSKFMSYLLLNNFKLNYVVANIDIENNITNVQLVSFEYCMILYFNK